MTEVKDSAITDKMTLAGHISEHVEIESIRLATTSAQNRWNESNPPQNATVKCEIQVKTEFDPEKERIVALPSLELIAFPSQSGPEAYFLRIESTFVAVYKLASGQHFSEEEISAFGEINGVFNVWPYWREYVQSTTNRMGLPTLTLNVYRVAAQNGSNQYEGQATTKGTTTSQEQKAGPELTLPEESAKES